MNLATNIKLGKQIWLAMDGGAKNAYGSFGWVIANDSFKLWEGKGCVYGNPDIMQLLRTESAGLLAVLHFIYQYIQYNNILIDHDLLLHFCDNSTVVSRMNYHNKTLIENPTNVTQPYWDIHMSIAHANRQLKLVVNMKHVSGHQDTRNRPNSMTMINIPCRNNVKTSKKLTWEAHLNIHANELATQALNDIIYTTPSKKTFHYIPQAK
eukprot:2604823-Ditylum_brightwellii.AAC.1